MTAPALNAERERPPHPQRSVGGRRAQPGHVESAAPRISVVTAVLNRKEQLERTIQSVLANGRGQVEHIIVDGGSTDGTLDVLRKYDSQLAYWISEPDSGIFDAMNKGVALARGAYIHLLNSDDYYCDGALDAVVREIDRTHADMVYGDYIFVVQDVGLERRIVTTADVQQGMTIGHALFIARAVYERIGLYDTAFRFSGDLDFMLRMKAAGFTLHKLDQPLQYFSSGGASEKNLVSSCSEAGRSVARHAGAVYGVIYMLKATKRFILRGVNALIGIVAGRRAYLSVKRRYYIWSGYKPRT